MGFVNFEMFSFSKYGSFIFDDYRNIYLNMAAINDYQNFATIEFGADKVASDDAATPKGEAGVTFKSGNMVIFESIPETNPPC